VPHFEKALKISLGFEGFKKCKYDLKNNFLITLWFEKADLSCCQICLKISKVLQKSFPQNRIGQKSLHILVACKLLNLKSA